MVLGSVSHPNLVKCLGFTQSAPFWALDERCNRGSLHEAVRRESKPGSLIQRIRERGLEAVVQLLEGISALHGDGVVHCDLHSKNILFHEEAPQITLRIADFGLATRLSHRKCHATIPFRDRELYGRLYPYLAPELLAGDTYSVAADMWAVGCMIKMILGLDEGTGREIEGVCKIRLSEEARASIAHCCSRKVNPRGRPMADKLLQTLRSSILH